MELTNDTQVAQRTQRILEGDFHFLTAAFAGPQCTKLHLVPVRLRHPGSVSTAHISDFLLEDWVFVDSGPHLWNCSLDRVVYTRPREPDSTCTKVYLVIFEDQEHLGVDAQNLYLEEMTYKNAPIWFGSILVMVQDAEGRVIDLVPEYIEVAKRLLLDTIYSQWTNGSND